MAITLNLISGATTISLTSNDAMLLDYVPTPVSRSEAEQPNATIAETIELLIYGAAETDIIAKTDAIDQLASETRRRQDTKTGDRVYLVLQLDASTDNWRSEILDMRLEFRDARPLTQTLQHKTPVLIHIERMPFWEGDETQLVSSTISNGNNANYVTINSSSIEGTLPAPVKVTYTNSTGADYNLSSLYLSCNTHNDPSNFSGFLDGGSISWTGAVTHSSDQISWTLTNAMLQDLAGDRFRVLAVFTTVNSQHYWRANTKFGLVTLQHGGENKTSNWILDLGSMPIPPGGYNTSSSSVKLTLSARHTASGSATLDFVQLLPANNFRYLFQYAYAIPNSSSLVDDGIDGVAYILSGGNRWPLVLPQGSPLMVYPGRSARLYALSEESGYGYTPGDSFGVTVNYRPRKTLI